MNKKNKILIFFLSFTLIVVSFIFSGAKTNAQEVSDTLIIHTNGYSELPSNIFIFNGSFSGNINEKPFTTYFEYKNNNNNLDTGANETIKIVRTKNIDKSGEFYTNPELKNFTTTYFRAVGYFNDNPSKKFYGGISSVQSGYIPMGYSTPPFTMQQSSPTTYTPITYTAPVTQVTFLCVIPGTILLDGVCKTPIDGKWSDWSTGPCSVTACGQTGKQNSIRTCTPPQDGGKACSLINGGLEFKFETCETAQCPINPGGGVSNPGAGGGSIDEGSNGSLVKCGLKDTDGTITNPCGFSDILILINTVINFIFKVLVIPIAAVMFAYAGFLLITAGGEAAHARTKAKEIFTNTAIGLIIAASCWIVIHTILSLGIVTYDASWIGF